MYVARRPADPSNFYPFFIPRRYLPRISHPESRIGAPLGASRLSARLIPNRISYPESVTLSIPTKGRRKVLNRRRVSNRRRVKFAPRTPAGVKNIHPQPKGLSKTHTLSPKVRPPDPGELYPPPIRHPPPIQHFPPTFVGMDKVTDSG